MGNLSVVFPCYDIDVQINLFYIIIVQEECKSRTLILIAGFIHDLSSFLDHHPGGRNLLIRGSGKEMTASFFGGVYTHSNAAHNVSCGFTTTKIHNKI
jgi:cytochrome b involved in lipid metabolism